MTSPLRRKRRIIAVPSMSARTVAKAAALALLLLASNVRAQDSGWQVPIAPATQPSPVVPTLTFHETTQRGHAGSRFHSTSAGYRPFALGESACRVNGASACSSSVGRGPLIQQTAFQQKYPVPGLPKLNTDESAELIIPLEPPGMQRLFRLDSEADMQERHEAGGSRTFEPPNASLSRRNR